MPPTAADELQTLRARLDAIDGVETRAARPGDAEEGRFQGYAAMRVENQPAVERLLARLGDTDGCRCNLPRRRAKVRARLPGGGHDRAERPALRPPLLGQHRIRRFLARRIAGDADRDTRPSLEPPEHVDVT